MINLYRVDDGALHWLFAENEEQVTEYMSTSFDEQVGELDWKDEWMDDLTVRKLDRDEEFTYILNTGTKVKLPVEDWIDLFYPFMKIPMYFGCSEW